MCVVNAKWFAVLSRIAPHLGHGVCGLRGGPRGGYTEVTVTVNDQVQQTSVSNLSAKTVIIILGANA